MKSTESFFLKASGFCIKLTFFPIEPEFYRQYLSDSIKAVWGEFIEKSSQKYDFQIVFKGSETMILAKRGDKDHYYLLSQRDFSKKRISLSYCVGLLAFTITLREIFAFLLEKDGFLLHGSALISTNKSLNIFIAPSGGGKSTTAKGLMGGALKHFCDDILIARKIRDRWIFFSPPFIEKDNLPRKVLASKARVFLVSKAKKASVETVKDKKGLIKKMARQLWLSHPILTKQILKNVMLFIDDNPFYNLNAVRDTKKMKGLFNEIGD
jgi:hypothetical protein